MKTNTPDFAPSGLSVTAVMDRGNTQPLICLGIDFTRIPFFSYSLN